MKTDDLRLDGQVTHVTGTVSGIGREIARLRARGREDPHFGLPGSSDGRRR
jgi:NAD(P)-dependent dehydrogenase (short-subunit alcohol dehydrogenase family)